MQHKASPPIRVHIIVPESVVAQAIITDLSASLTLSTGRGSVKIEVAQWGQSVRQRLTEPDNGV